MRKSIVLYSKVEPYSNSEDINTYTGGNWSREVEMGESDVVKN